MEQIQSISTIANNVQLIIHALKPTSINYFFVDGIRNLKQAIHVDKYH